MLLLYMKIKLQDFTASNIVETLFTSFAFAHHIDVSPKIIYNWAKEAVSG